MLLIWFVSRAFMGIGSPSWGFTTESIDWVGNSLSGRVDAAMSQCFARQMEFSEIECVLANLRALRQCASFRGRLERDFMNSCHLEVQEIRARTNFEITEVLNACEERDWTLFGHLRRQLEKENHNNIAVESKRVKRNLRRGADENVRQGVAKKTKNTRT